MIGKNDYESAKKDKICTRKIVLVAFDGIQAIDFTGPSSVFSRANEFVPDAYEIIHASPMGGQVTTGSGIVISELIALADLGSGIDTILIAGGSEDALRAAITGGKLPEWAAEMAPNVRRIGSVCTGAFVLAAAGLLDNRRAVTHWASCSMLQRLRPEINVEANAIFIKDGSVFSSAGVTASIDAALALVQEDLGRRVAADIAKSLVLYLRRSGGQSQYSNVLAAQSAAGDEFSDLINWISENLEANLSIDSLARRAAMSERNFIRKFHQETGVTPAAYVRGARLEAACGWLENTKWPVKRVAEKSGFGSQDSLERAIKKYLDTTSSALRRAYGE